jgi:hypothetical protein
MVISVRERPRKTRKRKDMPDKYEREIEDILRNIKSKEPEAGLRPIRRRASARRSSFAPQRNFPEWCLIIAIVAALLGGGLAYALGGGNIITGLIALVGAVCLALVALSSFIEKQRPSSSRWR